MVAIGYKLLGFSSSSCLVHASDHLTWHVQVCETGKISMVSNSHLWKIFILCVCVCVCVCLSVTTLTACYIPVLYVLNVAL